MNKLIILGLLLLTGCTKPLLFHYGDVVSWKVSPGKDFEFKKCKDNLGTIVNHLESFGFDGNKYYVDVGSTKCSFWMGESDLTKEGTSIP